MASTIWWIVSWSTRKCWPKRLRAMWLKRAAPARRG